MRERHSGEFILQDFLQHVLLGSLKVPHGGNSIRFVRHVREYATKIQDLFVVN